VLPTQHDEHASLSKANSLSVTTASFKLPTHLQEEVPASRHVCIKHNNDIPQRNILRLINKLREDDVFEAVVQVGGLAIDLPGTAGAATDIPAAATTTTRKKHGQSKTVMSHHESELDAITQDTLRYC
jgi:hypothetical protein